ncbi:MAG: repeat domain protein [Myxococcaceae bacterium]|nr:repeat domain protein [Myxococcaceae bacterium]
MRASLESTRALGRSRVVCVAVTAALLTVLSCRDATSITVEVTTDLVCDGSAKLEMGIAAGKLDTLETRPFITTRTWCEPVGGRIGSLVLVPSGDEDEEVAVRVVGAVGRSASSCGDGTSAGASFQGCIIERRVLRYQPHENQIVPILLSAACTNVPCGPTQTCRAGLCVAAAGTPPPTPDAATPADAATTPPPPPPPPTCSAPSATTCCGKTGCYGASCTLPALCTKCAERCGGDPKKKCCASATRIEGDGLNRIDCKDITEKCP